MNKIHTCAYCGGSECTIKKIKERKNFENSFFASKEKRFDIYIYCPDCKMEDWPDPTDSEILDCLMMKWRIDGGWAFFDHTKEWKLKHAEHEKMRNS